MFVGSKPFAVVAETLREEDSLRPLALGQPGLDPRSARLVDHVFGEGEPAFDVELVDLGVVDVDGTFAAILGGPPTRVLSGWVP